MNKNILISLHQNRQQKLRKKKELLLKLLGSEEDRKEAEEFYNRLIGCLDRIISYMQGSYKTGDRRTGETSRKY